jgi:hypothetical protein
MGVALNGSWTFGEVSEKVTALRFVDRGRAIEKHRYELSRSSVVSRHYVRVEFDLRGWYIRGLSSRISKGDAF